MVRETDTINIKKTIVSHFKNSMTRLGYGWLMIFAIIVGILTGGLEILFREMLIWFSHLFSPQATPLWGIFGAYHIIAVLVIGGLAVGLLTHFFAPEAKGHGVPEVMAASITRGGKIRPRVVVIKALASAITIASGGSAGREGPIVQMGSAAGSSIAQMLKLNPYKTKILLAAGAAGGIAATFNTPIAGVLFAVELIIRELKTRSFIPIVLSSVFAAIISRTYLQHLTGATTFMFPISAYGLKTYGEIMFYPILGVAAGLVAIAFVKIIYRFEDIFDSIKIPEYWKPAIGGVILGAIALVLLKLTGHTFILGVGYSSIMNLFGGNIIPWLVLLLILLKIIATSLTLSSGGSGGIFAPSLVIGAMTGAAFGWVVHQFFPDITAVYQAYTVVGMAAVFAGASRAPLTAILIVFELTGDYSIILPLMTACVISVALSAFLMKDTIYTKKLSIRGIRVESDMEINMLSTISVHDIIRPGIDTISEDATVSQLSKRMMRSGHLSFPVVDKDEKLIGIINYATVKKAWAGKSNEPVKNIMNTNVVTVYPDDSLQAAVDKISFTKSSLFPVVNPENHNELVGCILKSDIMRAVQNKKQSEFE